MYSKTFLNNNIMQQHFVMNKTADYNVSGFSKSVFQPKKDNVPLTADIIRLRYSKPSSSTFGKTRLL